MILAEICLVKLIHHKNPHLMLKKNQNRILRKKEVKRMKIIKKTS